MRTSDALVAFVLGLVVTLAVTPIVVLYLCRANLFDGENERTSHSGRIPRGGGLAVVVAAGVAVIYSLFAASDTHDLAGVAGCSLLFAMLGLVDDHRSLSAAVRLFAQVALAAGLVAVLQPNVIEGPTLVVYALEVLWIVGLVNVFNFMDGINGISSMTSAIVGGTIVVASVAWGTGGAALLAAAVTGASIGFLPSNFPHAKVFLGDVGSYGIGAALSVSALMAADGGVPVLTVLPVFGLYVADVAWTLLDRLRRHQPLLSAHRDHVYQRLANGGWGHRRTATTVSVITLSLSFAGLAAGAGSSAVETISIVGTLAILGLYLSLPDRAEWRIR